MTDDDPPPVSDVLDEVECGFPGCADNADELVKFDDKYGTDYIPYCPSHAEKAVTDYPKATKVETDGDNGTAKRTKNVIDSWETKGPNEYSGDTREYTL